MAYRFVLPVSVKNRLYDHALYIAEDSPSRALSWLDEVTDRMRSLVELPLAHPVAEEETERLGYEVRKLNLGSYLAIYRVDEANRSVVMVDFRHGAQLPDQA